MAESPAESLLRKERNAKLAETDWWTLGDTILSCTTEKKVYRQALRDLPYNSSPEIDKDGNLTNVIWPIKPE